MATATTRLAAPTRCGGRAGTRSRCGARCERGARTCAGSSSTAGGCGLWGRGRGWGAGSALGSGDQGVAHRLGRVPPAELLMLPCFECQCGNRPGRDSSRHSIRCSRTGSCRRRQGRCPARPLMLLALLVGLLWGERASHARAADRSVILHRAAPSTSPAAAAACRRCRQLGPPYPAQVQPIHSLHVALALRRHSLQGGAQVRDPQAAASVLRGSPVAACGPCNSLHHPPRRRAPPGRPASPPADTGIPAATSAQPDRQRVVCGSPGRRQHLGDWARGQRWVPEDWL